MGRHGQTTLSTCLVFQLANASAPAPAAAAAAPLAFHCSARAMASLDRALEKSGAWAGMPVA